MPKYRDDLPQLSGDWFLTEGGLETHMIFIEGIDLPEFSSIVLLASEEGRQAWIHYLEAYIQLAIEHGVGLILDTPTWRASMHWADQLGMSVEELNRLSADAAGVLDHLRMIHETPGSPIVISGALGPKQDAYQVEEGLTVEQAKADHQAQVDFLATTEVDMLTAYTLSNSTLAIGMVKAAQQADIPIAISFTLETDGRLPSGETLQEAIERVDEATEEGPVYYMINCAHPTHFLNQLQGTGPWLDRLWGLKANASHKSHAELDKATELDAGDPKELALLYGEVSGRLKHLRVIGGCCGTNHEHVGEVAAALLSKI